MSIFCTWLSFDDDDTPPIRYQGSVILPSRADPRGGYLDVSAIPSHIVSGKRHGPEGKAPRPWLRMGVNDSTVILDRGHVRRLHATLGEWLKEIGGP